MPQFAVIKTGGKQYLVSPGRKLKIEKIPGANPVIFDEVLLVGNEDKIEFGTPLVKNAKVKAELIGDGKRDKVVIFRYHSKTRYRKLKGHRQPFTEVLIKEIVAK